MLLAVPVPQVVETPFHHLDNALPLGDILFGMLIAGAALLPALHRPWQRGSHRLSLPGQALQGLAGRPQAGALVPQAPDEVGDAELTLCACKAGAGKPLGGRALHGYALVSHGTDKVGIAWMPLCT